MDRRPEVTTEETNHQGRFIMFKTLEWTDAHGVSRKWEMAERVADKGAVLIIARIMPSDRLVLIRQYRPPVRREVYEFPAGLIDEGETPEQAAARELLEETGYTATRMIVHPAAYTTPGLSNESVCMVMAEIDETRPENINPETHFDAGESIETFLIEKKQLPAFYRRESESGFAFDAKLAAFILTLPEA